MMNRRTTHFQLFMTVIMIVSLSLPMLYHSPEATAIDPEDLTRVNLYLKHDSNTDYYMNSIQEDPADTNAVDEVIWYFGWWDGNNVVGGELLSNLYIEGTFSGGTEVFVEVSVSFLALTGNTDVTMQLRDNGQVIAETTETLDNIFGNNENSYWQLPFKDGSDHHTFSADHTISVRVSSDNGQVNIAYRTGNARVEFNTNQLDAENAEFGVKDSKGINMYGKEFVPKYPAGSNLGVAHLWGVVLDAFGPEDIDVIDLIIEGPQGQVGDPIPVNPQVDMIDDVPWVAFHYNWSYGDDLDGVEDAGTYYVTFDVIDNNGNNFTFEEEVRFIMSKYGVYLTLANGEVDEKNEGPGKYVHYDLVVYNAGLVDDDTLELTHNNLPGDWEAEIVPDSVTLDSEDSATILLNVTIPADEEVEESVEVKVTATSQKSDADAEYNKAISDIRTTTRVSADAKISVYFRKQDSDDDNSEWVETHAKKGNAEKGEDRDFNFRVKNDSPSDDNISLYLDGLPNDWSGDIIDPDTEEEVTYVNLVGNDEVLLFVRVRPATAQSASNRADLEITGVSGNNESVSSTAYLNVTRTLGVVVSVNDVERDKLLVLKPGIPNTIDFILENTGNEERTFNLDTDLSSLNQDEWTIELVGGPSITVDSGKSEIFSMDITPPDSAINLAGGYSYVIIAEDQEDANVRYEFTVEMNVETQYKLEVEITIRERTIKEAGDSVEYIIYVKNSGNSKVTITLSLTKDKSDWGAELDETAAEFEPGATPKEFILTVTAPDPVDHKATCTVTVTATVLNHPETAKSVPTKTVVKKDDVNRFSDILSEYAWMFIFPAIAAIIGLVLYYHSKDYEEYDEDEDEEYDEDNENEEDDWE